MNSDLKAGRSLVGIFCRLGLEHDIRAVSVPLFLQSGKSTIEGDDDTNSKNTHTFSMVVRLEVNLESDDVRITSIDLSPSTLQCSRDVTMSVNVRNHGSNDQDEVRMQIDNDALGIDQDFEFVLEEAGEDDDARRSFGFSVPDTQRAGSYPIDVHVFIDGDELEDEERASLRVEDCGATDADEEEEEEPSVVTTPPTTTPTTGGDTGGITGGAVFETVEVPFTQSNAFLALMIVGIIAVLGLIVFLAVSFAK
jgi:hypothetical protein